MEKIPKPPKDYYEIKSKIVTKFLSYTSTKAWVFFCMLFAYETMNMFGMKYNAITATYAELWVGLVVLFYFLPHIVFRFVLKYRTVPQNMTLGQFRARDKLTHSPFVKKAGIIHNIRKDGLVKILKIIAYLVGYVAGLRMAFWGLAYVTNNPLIYIILVSIVVLTPALLVSRYMISHRSAQMKNALAIRKAVYEARCRHTTAKMIIAFSICASLGILPFLILYHILR